MAELRADLDGSGQRFAIVVSRFNAPITESLLEAARATLSEHGVAAGDVLVVHVPGAWEIPLAATLLADRDEYAAILALGCIIRGETPHFDYIAGATARELAALAVRRRTPIVFGVLTTDDAEQAWARAGGGERNKGREAALAALEIAGVAADLRREPRP